MYGKKQTKKKAFTLIELLIVIAIIGILFIVLVSRVDFATDKAKATGVQTDFRSFQMAFDQVAKENAGFNIFGWNTGDDNGDRIRNSYDRGDTNKNGKEDAGETFVGRKTYGEDWTTIYTMLNPDTTKPNDTSAFVAVEQAINANLDPKLHITITPDVDDEGKLTGDATITMANQARDPWKNEYHGVFITNADEDGQDRGAIIIYSNGANGKWGSAHDITNGVVSITVPYNNKLGQDDMSIVSCYTYVNGYGEILNMTTGFSTNKGFLNGGGTDNISIDNPINTPNKVAAATFNSSVSENCNCQNGYHECLIPISPVTLTWDELMLTENGQKYGYRAYAITETVVDSRAFAGCRSLISINIPENITSIGGYAFNGCINLVDVTIDANITTIVDSTFKYCDNLTTVTLPDTLTAIHMSAFYNCYSLTSITIPDNVISIGDAAFLGCSSLTNVVLSQNLETMANEAFRSCDNLTQIVIPDSVKTIGERVFCNNSNLTNVILGDGVQTIGSSAFSLTNLSSITLPASLTSLGTSVFSGCGGLQVSYADTVEQWNFIQKDSKWGYYQGNYAVRCTNGTVAADGTITYN